MKSPRRQERSVNPEALDDLHLELHDYHIPKVRKSSPRPWPKLNLEIIDDLSEVVPISVMELELFEQYCADLLDELFGKRT
jgi:hypothetical protein